MFKETNKIFLIISLFIIIILTCLFLNELCLKYLLKNNSNDDYLYKEIGVEVVDMRVWPKGAPTKRDWANILADCLEEKDELSLARCQYILERIESYNDCVLAGFAILESYPEKCQTSDGRVFINH